MNVWEEKLLGELVGLARASDGNEHLITNPAAQVIADILKANVKNEAQYFLYSAKIDAAKREMVPDCFHCANPCGRTAALDLKTLEGESDQIRQVKHAVLTELQTLAVSEQNQERNRKLFRGLVILGLDGYSPDELSALYAEP